MKVFQSVLPASLTLAVFFFACSTSQASPLTLELTIDRLTEGRAVLSGDLDEIDFPRDLWAKEVIGAHWRVSASLVRFSAGAGAGFYYQLHVEGQHIKEPPHEGEAKDGLTLCEFCILDNIGGLDPKVWGEVGPQVVRDALTHPGSIHKDKDTLIATIEDLNGEVAGFLTAGRQMSATIELEHTAAPEPATLFLFGSGLAGVAAFRKRRGLMRQA